MWQQRWRHSAKKIIHKQVTVDLKTGKVDVDEGISPLILWMDSFKSVNSYSSCQGYGENLPYVWFSANTRDLTSILNFLQAYHYASDIATEVGYNPIIPPRNPKLRYTIRFLDPLKLENVIKRILGRAGQNEKSTM